MKRDGDQRDCTRMSGRDAAVVETEPTTRGHTLSLTQRRLVLAVPQVILLTGMTVMLVLHPNAVRSGVMSTRAIVVNAALLAAWVLLSFVVLPRLVRNVWLRAGLLTVGAVVAVVLLVLPTVRDTKVVEQFPVAAPAASSVPSAHAAPTDSTPATAPERVSTGELIGIDHDAAGRASIFRQPDGGYVVGLEDIDIEPGPDYRVYLVPTPNAEHRGDGTELAGLRGNQGTQYYEVPRSVGDPGARWTVLIWCRAFGVPVAAATQAAQ